MDDGARPGRGTFIALEGGEGSGKSTQAGLLAERLDAVLTYEPGATDLGSALRRILLDPSSTAGLDDRAEALLMAADRAQHVAAVVGPALEAGRTVVCDRYIGSSLAYQGHGRGLGVDAVAALSAFATGGLLPDVYVLLDVPRDVAEGRLTGRPDRLEGAGADFHERVRAGYRDLAAADPDRWLVVSGVGSPVEVADRLAAALGDRLGSIV